MGKVRVIIIFDRYGQSHKCSRAAYYEIFKMACSLFRERSHKFGLVVLALRHYSTTDSDTHAGRG